MSESELKTLNFVPTYSQKGYKLATDVYSAAKSKLPAPVVEKIEGIESTVSERAAPYVSIAQDKGSEILKVVDDQVDKAVQNAGQVYQSNSAYIQSQLEKQRELHAKNLETYKAAREQYLKKIEDSVEFVKTNGLSGAARKAADEVTSALNTAKSLSSTAVTKVHEAFQRLLAFEPVQKVLASAKPAIDTSYSKYMSIHDSVVASPQYKRAFDLSQAAVMKAQESFIYRKAKENLYPYVAKYADPAVAQITASSYYQAAVEHVLPKTASA